MHRKKILNSIKRLKKQEKLERQQLASSVSSSSSSSSPRRRKNGRSSPSNRNSSTAIVPATIDEISSDEDEEESKRDAKISAGKSELDELFSWIRHRHTDKIMEAFESFSDEEFLRDNIKYQFIEDIGTQYTDEYNFNRHVNIVDNKGNTFYRCSRTVIAKFLLKKSHQNAQGQTALHYAMAYDFFEFGSWLTSEDGAKADDTILNMHLSRDGLSPE